MDVNKRAFISATDKNMERFAVPLFESFRLWDKETPCFCVVRDVSPEVRSKLIALGVKVIPFDTKITPQGIEHTGVTICNYLPPEYELLVHIDIDALIVKPIDEIWIGDFDAVFIPGNDGNKWLYKNPNDGHKYYYAMGMKRMKRSFADTLADGYRKWKDGKDHDGTYVRNYIINNHLEVQHFNGSQYYCGREMVEMLRYEEHKLFFVLHRRIIFPSILQFNNMGGNNRPQSEAVNQWKKDNLSL